MPIRILDSVVASRIAAGEIIERPSSALRELLDNAIDSGASKISVWIEEGGIRSMTVSDNGCGIPKEDLPLAFESHATSKVTTLEDIYNLQTLGFRGEALCSIAAVSSLTIQSDSVKLCCNNGVTGSILPGSVSAGTTVTMEDLFGRLPARKQFLRRPSTEAADCKKVFIEKALGYENIEFLFFDNGKLDTRFPAQTQLSRCAMAMSLAEKETFEMKAGGDEFTLHAVAALPSVYRRDRTQVRIFVNNRITDNYQLTQAVVSAYSVALPGGVFPYFYLFIEDNPQLVDFNIHPSKRECKLRNSSSVYGMTVTMIRNALLEISRKEKQKLLSSENNDNNNDKEEVRETRTLFSHETGPYSAQTTPEREETQPADASADIAVKPDWLDNAKKILGAGVNITQQPVQKIQENTKIPENTEIRSWSYIGQVFNTYLLVQTDSNLIFIDQHAAHERILFEELKQIKDTQKLIVPYKFETDSPTDRFLTEKSFIYHDSGITLVRDEPMVWEIVEIPAVCRKNEKEIADYISKACGDPETVRKGLFAIIACHAAVKAGDILNRATAVELIEKTFRLDALLCPHGRNFTYTVSLQTLNREVGRDI